MTHKQMETVREGDLVVHKFKLKERKRMPGLVIDVGESGRLVTIMNPIRGLVDISLDMWEFVHEDR